MAREPLIVYLDPEVKAALERIGRAEDGSASRVARRAIGRDEEVAAAVSEVSNKVAENSQQT